MKVLFAPAVAMLNRMRYPAKFMLLGLIAFLVIGFLLVQLTLSLRSSIIFAEKELDSIQRVPTLLKVIELAQQHRGLSSGVLNGNEELRPRLQKKTEELVAAMKVADEILTTGATPSAKKRWNEVDAGWEALRSGGLGMKPRDNLVAAVGQQQLFFSDFVEWSFEYELHDICVDGGYKVRVGLIDVLHEIHEFFDVFLCFCQGFDTERHTFRCIIQDAA